MRPAKLTDAQALMLYAKAPLAIKQEFMDAVAFVNVLRFFEKSYGIVEPSLPAPALPSHAWCAAIDDELEATAAEDTQPVAWFAFADSNGPVPMELWGWDEKACRSAVLTYARGSHWKGTVEGYLFDQQWTLRPVYLATPQPVEVQRVAYLQFLSDVLTGAGLIEHGRQDKKLAERLAIGAAKFRTVAQPVALEPLSRAEVDRLVYQCRQSGDDSTYALATAIADRLRGITPSIPLPAAAVAEGLERDGNILEQAA